MLLRPSDMRWNTFKSARRARPNKASTCCVAPLLFGARLASSYTLDPNSRDSVVSVASDMADDMMSFYTGDQPGQTPGLLPQPYYWWEGGAFMGALIDYWYYTGDGKWNNVTSDGLLAQVGPDKDYMPPSQTMTEGNDDQGFWGMAVLSAAEYNFPNPPADQPQWLALAQAVFNTQAVRWDTGNCNGGLRWQIFQWNNGYDYKNSISQACFFNIAARLALYTRNGSYADWANRVWDWMIDVEFMTEDPYYIYDGAHIEDNCTKITPYQWTYNTGAFLLGAAAMYNYSAESDPAAAQTWYERVNGVLNGSHVFFIGKNRNIMAEVACESVHLCDDDQLSFKAYLSRWMAATTKWAPWTYKIIKPLLAASATAAAEQCTGGTNGRMCGLMWANNSGKWDGTTGPGQQMAAMEVVLANMIKDLGSPVTNSTGGTSIGNPNAGTDSVGKNSGLDSLAAMRPITNGDRAGGWIITFFAMAFLLSGIRYVFVEENGGQLCSEKTRGFTTDGGPGGLMRNGSDTHQEKGMTRLESNSEKPTRLLNLDGAPSSLLGPAVPRKDPVIETVSTYMGDETRPALTVSLMHDYPDEQPWRRPAREGDFAGAFDPSRGNGAGFSIMDTRRAARRASRAAASSTAGTSSNCGRLKEALAVGAGKARDLTTKTKGKLMKKPLPGKPGLGRKMREQDADRDGRKV